MDYLQTQMLVLSVWHHDTFGRNSFLGEVDVDLSKWDFDHTQMNYLALKAKVQTKHTQIKAALSVVLSSNISRSSWSAAHSFLSSLLCLDYITKDVSPVSDNACCGAHKWERRDETGHTLSASDQPQ